MRVTVVGAGIVGVCTAWALAEAGCEVTVVERHNGVAQEASHGNAGMVAPAYVTPWAAPGMPRRVLSMLFADAAPVRFAPTLDPALWRFVARWTGECRAARFRVNKARMQRLAFYSRDVLGEWRTRHHLSYERTEGALQLLRTERDARHAETTLAFLDDAGVSHRLLSDRECRIREPGLADVPFAGGIHLPDAETGNCPLFARQLRALAESHGVRFEFGTSVAWAGARDGQLRLVLATREASRVVDPGVLVVAAGNASRPLLDKLGIRAPIYPVKGYAATVAIREPTYAPIAAVMDEAYKVAIVRMGNRIRIAGTAELGDPLFSLETRRAERALGTLLKVARDWFPGAANYTTARPWVGARPMLPDGPPLLGATRHRGVFVNVGHGSSGWAMAAGSARVVADVVMGRTPDIDLEGLTLERYR